MKGKVMLLSALVFSAMTWSFNTQAIASDAQPNAIAPSPPVIEAFLKTQREECAKLDNGVMHVNEGGIQMVADFNKDGVTDPIFDSGVMSCTSSATLFGGGSGGRYIHVFVSTPDENPTYQHFEFLGEGNVTTSLGNTAILLLIQNGANCGVVNAIPCFSAFSWVDGKFVTNGQTVKQSGDIQL